MDAGARFRTIASIAFTALIFALAATEVISAPSIMQANTLAFASADSLQCSLPDVDDERISVIIIDLLNDHSDSASNRAYLKEEKSEEPLIGGLIGLSRRQTRARAPPGTVETIAAIRPALFLRSLRAFGSKPMLPQISISGSAPFHHVRDY
jgi:hypothetical protein